MSATTLRPSGPFAVFDYLVDAAPKRVAIIADVFRSWCTEAPPEAHAVIAAELGQMGSEYVDRWKAAHALDVSARGARQRDELGQWLGLHDAAQHAALRASLSALSSVLLRRACPRFGAERGRHEQSVRDFIEGVAPIAPAEPVEALAAQPVEVATEAATWWEGGKVELRLVRRVAETHDVNTFEFEATDGRLFRYLPGQSIAMTFVIDGAQVKRSYTISSSPTRADRLHLTIKRVPGGVVSNWMADHAKVGDVFNGRGPNGRFSCAREAPRKMLLLSGGSGITPVLSMTRFCHDRGLDVDIVFVHAARREEDLIAADELSWYARRMEAFRTVYVLSEVGPEDAWDGLRGYFDATKLYSEVPDFVEREVYLCGPNGFMDAMRGVFADANYDMSRFHYESFGGAAKTRAPQTTLPTIQVSELVQKPSAAALSGALGKIGSGAVPRVKPPTPAAPAAPAPAPAEDGALTITLNGVVLGAVPGEEPLLDEIEDAGGELNSSCRSGSCGTCKVKCVSGEVEFENGGGLTDDEVDEGFILTCVSLAKSALVLECAE